MYILCGIPRSRLLKMNDPVRPYQTPCKGNQLTRNKRNIPRHWSSRQSFGCKRCMSKAVWGKELNNGCQVQDLGLLQARVYKVSSWLHVGVEVRTARSIGIGLC